MITEIPISSDNRVFKAQDFSNKSFAEHSFSNCIFEKCDFNNSSFERASLWECTFRECNLSLVNFKKCRINNVSFEESKLVGINFSLCDTSLLFSINAHKSYLQYCTFAGLLMAHTSFKESKIIESRFIDTILKKACFSGTDLAGTTFNNCDLRESDFKDAINYLINPCENKIKKAIFSFPECIGLVKSLDITILE